MGNVYSAHLKRLFGKGIGNVEIFDFFHRQAFHHFAKRNYGAIHPDAVGAAATVANHSATLTVQKQRHVACSAHRTFGKIQRKAFQFQKFQNKFEGYQQCVDAAKQLLQRFQQCYKHACVCFALLRVVDDTFGNDTSGKVGKNVFSQFVETVQLLARLQGETCAVLRKFVLTETKLVAGKLQLCAALSYALCMHGYFALFQRIQAHQFIVFFVVGGFQRHRFCRYVHLKVPCTTCNRRDCPFPQTISKQCLSFCKLLLPWETSVTVTISLLF